MAEIRIGSRTFDAPVLVPSVSSFETQLLPIDALRLQYTLREPITLVSAYDIYKKPDEVAQLCRIFRAENTVILMDSGGYETSRIGKYSGTGKAEWPFKDYIAIAEQDDVYDLIFSYDYFIEPGESVLNFQKRLITEFRKHADHINLDSLIPVLHVTPFEPGHNPISETDTLELVGSIAVDLGCRFVAVPERELGQGLLARAMMVKKLDNRLKRDCDNCGLHVLGCGNLLSFAFLGSAGAQLCDGLEWCRTCSADNFHLHHFQQGELFPSPQPEKLNPSVEWLAALELDYGTKTAIRNLIGFQAFSASLQRHLKKGTVNEFVSENFGTLAAKKLSEAVS